MKRRRALLALAFVTAFGIGLSGWEPFGYATPLPAQIDGSTSPVAGSGSSAASEHEPTNERRSAAARRASRGMAARPCILHRESRGVYTLPPNGAGASGAYQFTPVAWDATARRAGRGDLVGVAPYRASRADQDAMYLAAWRHGNGRFYWSARWGAPYACFPGDTRPMRSGS